MESPAPEHEEQVLSIDFRRYLAALRKYVWLLAALIVLSVAGAVIYTTRQIPIYQATASVQVEPVPTRNARMSHLRKDVTWHFRKARSAGSLSIRPEGRIVSTSNTASPHREELRRLCRRH